MSAVIVIGVLIALSAYQFMAKLNQRRQVKQVPKPVKESGDPYGNRSRVTAVNW